MRKFVWLLPLRSRHFVESELVYAASVVALQLRLSLRAHQLNIMTTFTKIPDSQQPVISINPSHKISRIDDNTYGGFAEFVPLSRYKS